MENRILTALELKDIADSIENEISENYTEFIAFYIHTKLYGASAIAELTVFMQLNFSEIQAIRISDLLESKGVTHLQQTYV